MLCPPDAFALRVLACYVPEIAATGARYAVVLTNVPPLPSRARARAVRDLQAGRVPVLNRYHSSRRSHRQHPHRRANDPRSGPHRRPRRSDASSHAAGAHTRRALPATPRSLDVASKFRLGRERPVRLRGSGGRVPDRGPGGTSCRCGSFGLPRCQDCVVQVPIGDRLDLGTCRRVLLRVLRLRC